MDNSRPNDGGGTVDVVGTAIAATSYEEVLDLLLHPRSDRANVVAFCNVHSVMVARDDPALHRALQDADLATPDGMPLVWTLRRSGHPGQGRVYGPDLMEMAIGWGTAHDLGHYFFGATDDTVDRLLDNLVEAAPAARLLGRHSPPFRPPTPEEETAVVEDILQSGATVVWVGLGMPKQELWMHRIAPRLPGVTLLGVGAAFDFLAGTVAQAPDRVQRLGLEWLYRLAKEPRRLWRRYAVNNPRFVVLVALQLRRRGATGEFDG